MSFILLHIIQLFIYFLFKIRILYENKYIAYRKFGKLYLKVVFGKVAENMIIIITQHFVKKIP